MRSFLLPLLASLSALVGVACGQGEPNDAASSDSAINAASTTAPSAEEQKACEVGKVVRNAAGDSVLRCTQPFAAAPGVRLPADTKSGATVTLYGGASVPTDFSGAFALWDRDGKRYVPVDAAGAPIPYDGGARKLPAFLHAPTNRMTFTIYQFTGTLGAALDSPEGPAVAIRLKSARPVVEIDGCALDSRLLGTWEGSASERMETPVGYGPMIRHFDESKRVPIHVTLAGIARRPVLAEFVGGGKMLSDAQTFNLTGVIDNFDKDVTVDGKTYRSLKALGTKSPFFQGKDGKVELYRLGNMHGTRNDGHWVFTFPGQSKDLTSNGMSYTLTAFTAPDLLFNPGVKAPAIQQLEIKPHIPYLNNGHTVVLLPVKIGAKTGTCGT
jgi:hypothetical protein